MSTDLSSAGLTGLGNVHHNLTPTVLFEHAIRRGEGSLAKGGALITRTGKYTGRSPNDKFTVLDETTKDDLWWGKENRSITPEIFDGLHGRVAAYLRDRDVFVQDCFAGHDPNHRIKVRIITERAWHSAFAHNMFIQATDAELKDFVPDYTVVQAPGFKAVPDVDNTHSEAAIFVNYTKKLVVICGSEYAGEIKKSIFTVLNFLLPVDGVLGMHCSANVGEDGDAALFFGLSGTGKTTLSADPKRGLVGDDEHGWGHSGIFNFEGGCYAKVIRLDPKAEPEIFATTGMSGTLLENVVFDPDTRELDLNDATFAENTRCSYDIGSIPNIIESGRGGHPKNIVLLTADAFGVLPPLSALTPAQAMYHFISGYTAKVAGTERGVTEPQAVFSACFGSPFMARHPTVYAELLGKKIAEHGSRCWLVNTGWSGGPYGVGDRMKIQWTRALLNAALSGELNDAPFEAHPIFQVGVPTSVAGVPDEILNPRNTWADKDAYDAKAKHLASLFAQNFAEYSDYASDEIKAAGPKA